MKEQYVGDISDYRKYALLRALAGPGGLKPRVCWMLTPPDQRADGNKVQYLKRPEKWRGYDSPLFDLLKSVVDDQPSERLREIEQSGIVPGAGYFNDILPDDLTGRRRYFIDAAKKLSVAALVFFDPDNGLEVPSNPKGRKGPSKYLYFDEVAGTYSAGHSVLIYQHFAREERDAYVARLGERLRQQAYDALLWEFRTSLVVFLLLAQPQHDTHIQNSAIAVAQWEKDFIAGRAIATSEWFLEPDHGAQSLLHRS
jgi:hypothetical protein